MGRRKAADKEVGVDKSEDGSGDGVPEVKGKKSDSRGRGRPKRNMSYAEYSDEESDENAKSGKTKGKRVVEEDSEGEDSEDATPKKMKATPKKAAPKPRAKTPAKKEAEDDDDDEEEEEEEEEGEGEEDELEEDEDEGEEGDDGEDSANGNAADDEIPKDIPLESEHILKSSFRPGDFLVEKADKDKPESEMPVWRIEGKSLLQRYRPFKDEKSDRILYKNASSYTGYTADKKEVSLPVDVMILVNQKRNSIVKVMEIGKDEANDK